MNAFKRVHFQSIASTNEYCKEKREERENLIVTADFQTGGRGTKGRSFDSALGGVYLSKLTFYSNYLAKDAFLIMASAAVAVCETLRFYGLSPVIKWANDVFVQDKKICGILAEAVLDMAHGGFAVFAVGIGINLSTEDFPEDIAEIAASLKTDADRNEIAAGIAQELFSFAKNLSAREFLAEYREHSLVTGKEIYFIKDGEKTNAAALGIDDDGGLTVRLENGEVTTLRGGEISVRIK